MKKIALIVLFFTLSSFTYQDFKLKDLPNIIQKNYDNYRKSFTERKLARLSEDELSDLLLTETRKEFSSYKLLSALVNCPKFTEIKEEIKIQALYFLLCQDNKDALELMLKNGIDVNCLIPNNLIEKKSSSFYSEPQNWLPHAPIAYTPLIIACKNNNTQLAKLLLEYGADVSSIPAFSQTETMHEEQFISPLAFACSYNNKELVEILLSFYPPINFSNQKEASSVLIPFSLACQFNNIDIAVLFLVHYMQQCPTLASLKEIFKLHEQIAKNHNAHEIISIIQQQNNK